MKKSEIFDIVINKVGEICEVDAHDIINDSKIQSVVVARSLVVHYLKRIGMTSDEIAQIALKRQACDPSYSPSYSQIKQKAKSVDKMAIAYYERKSAPNPHAFELQEMDVKRFLHEEYAKVKEPWMTELD